MNPPSRVELRYGRTLLHYSDQQKEASQIYDAAKLLREALIQKEEVVKALRHPLITDEEKKEAILKASPDLPNGLVDFLHFLALRKRIELLPGILLALIQEFEKRENLFRATVKSPFPLSKESEKRIRTYLEKEYNGEFLLTFQNAPELIGGFLIDLGDRVVDCSVQHQLQKLQQQLSV